MADPSSPFYTEVELLAVGFSSVGRDVQVSRLARFYGIHGVIGDCSRIDDFCILKGAVEIGAFVHVSAFSMISGSAGTIHLHDFATVASHVSIYTGTDDHFGSGLMSGRTPRELQVTKTGDVRIEEGAAVGSHCVIFPNTVMEEYSTLGAQCIGTGRFAAGKVHVTGAGRPRAVADRDLDLLRARAAETRRRLAAGELQA
jgi:acetyltransferase-like isoleucine patch superfamily enzyme